MLPHLFSDRLEYIFRNMEDAVCVTGDTGNLLYANAAAQQLFGLKADGSAKIWDAIPYVDGNDALIQLFIDIILKQQKAAQSYVDYFDPAGKRYRLQISLSYHPDDPPMFLLVITDMTRLERVQSAFARYTSPEIADFVLSTPEGGKQGGQSRDVTILMSDLRGFTALSASIPAADLIGILNHYFEQMTAVIQRHRGTVIEFLGDGIFVVFGAPGNVPAHAEEAVRCAVEMQNAMLAVNRWNEANGYPALEMGIGISSGPVIVGNIGSDIRMKYGCIGQPVNLAGRIESYTVGGQIYVSEFTRDLIAAPLSVADSKAILPKGAGHEIRIYDVTGVGGDCSLTAPALTEDFTALPAPLPLRFYRMDEKIVSPLPLDGLLTKLTRDEKNGVLSVHVLLDPLENLMLRIGEHDFYAKVISAGPKEARIRFTSSPVPLSRLNG